MASETKWKPGKKDAIFLAIVIGVIVVLSVSGGKRTTKATPDDAIHRAVTSHLACMQCHGPGSEHPQPAGHTKSEQCFLCHTQPKGWKGSAQ